MSKNFSIQIDRGTLWRRRQLGLSWFRLTCALVAWGTVGAGCAGTVSSSGWIRLQTAHFEFISSVDADETRQLAERLELFLDVVAHVVSPLELQLRQPMRVYVFSDRKAFDRIRPRSKAAGYFSHREDAIQIAIDASDTEKSLEKLYVDLVHFALGHEAPRSFPPWYTEGVAEFMSTTRSSQGAVWVGDISGELATWLHYASPLPLRLVMTVSDIRGWSEPARARFRAQSWALVHFFNTAHLAGFPPRSQDAGRFRALIERGMNPDEACREAFGTDFKGLEGDFLRYMAMAQFPILTLPRSILPTRTVGNAQPIEALEMLTLLSGLPAAFEVDDSERARVKPGKSTLDDARGPQIAVHEPKEGEVIRSAIEFAQIAGSGGIGTVIGQDVVIAIDESVSTFDATGRDVDGDGKVGRAGAFPKGHPSTPRVVSTGRVSLRPVRRRDANNVWRWSSDFGDTVIEAELLAARRLLEQLDPDTTRVAVITFAGKTNVLSQLTTPDEALEALDRYEVHLDWGGTNPTSALLEAVDVFTQPGRSSELRQRTVLLLSDGRLPHSRRRIVRDRTLRAARLLGQFGIRVHAFSLGSSSDEAPEFLGKIAKHSGGRFISVENAAEVVSELSNLPLTGLANVAMRNLRTGESGRAVRVFPDGSFDGYLRLEPGENEFEVIAEMESGDQIALKRKIFFQAPDHPTTEDLAAARRMQEELGLRTTEIELLAERRARQRGELKIEVER